MTAPTVLGQQYTATLTLGPDIYQIKIGYADNSKTARIFVASAVFSTNVGTLGLDSRCTDAAETAGLGGSWKAVVSTDSEDVINRIPWNWGTLKLVDNATVVASNWSDLWDGTIAHPINSDEYSNANLSYTVATGSTALGKRTIGKTRGNWVAGVYYYGSSSAASGSWMNLAPSYSTDSTDHFYCFEDTSAAPDTLPSILKIPYRVFQETSTLVTSESYDVKGITTAVNVSLADLSPSGIAGAQYSINNSGTWLAAGVSSTVNNGDTIQIRMTSPASLNSSYKATLTVGSSSAIPWRVWTKGVASGTTIKRFFSSNPIMPISIGGMAGADSFCQTSATTQGLGGTWKALLSGEGIDESNWAINRIGYLWTELWTMDGTGAAAVRLLSAPNLWNDSPLESLPNVSVAGALISTTTTVTTNTDKNGFGIYSGTGNCSTWTSGGLSNDFVGQSAGSLSDSQWLHTSGLFVYCNVSQRLYCVEQ